METKNDGMEHNWAWKVLTVPMRNGNPSCRSSLYFKSFHVLTVPMRNGNFLNIRFIVQYVLVLTVPMRNGNTLRSELFRVPSLGSYRTYEEWKPNTARKTWRNYYGSYRTYEEWKRAFCSANLSTSFSSYRTYEEWKRDFLIKVKYRDVVLTVPMRNGNSPLFSSFPPPPSVLTVPMRNGNNFVNVPSLVIVI